jgi:protein Jumonji
LLVKYGVSVTRTVQEPGQFLVVFPRCYTSHICTGYSIGENVYFATRDYLQVARAEFQNIKDSKYPMMFPLAKLLICIAQDECSTGETLALVKPLLEAVRDNEYAKRAMISDLGVKSTERIVLKKKKDEQEDEYECEVCSENLYVSYVSTINFYYQKVEIDVFLSK